MVYWEASRSMAKPSDGLVPVIVTRTPMGLIDNRVGGDGLLQLPPAFDRADYKARHAVECGINRLKVRHEVAHVKWESHEGRRNVLTPD